MQKTNQARFSIIEILVLLSLIWMSYAIISAPASNAWYTESSVLAQLKLENPTIVAIQSTIRKHHKKSVVYALDSAGTSHKYLLNTNLFYEYRFEKM